MRTTLNLDDQLMRAAKKEAAARGVTLTRVIEEALRAELAPRPAHDDFRLRVPVVRGRRPPAVDISDRDALYELMEETGERR
ncbi:MAG: ribbon-helix-helix protein, CopG family [Thermoleophilaceae bacterium]